MATFFENGLPIRESLIPFGPEFFNDENDHNPFVAKECVHCFGSGRITRGDWIEDGTVHVLSGRICEHCHGKGYFHEPIRFFTKRSGGNGVDNAPVTVVLRKHGNKSGAIHCPTCDRWFLPGDRQRFTGKRCGACGQKITTGKAAEMKPEVVRPADEMKKLSTNGILAELRRKS